MFYSTSIDDIHFETAAFF